MSLDGLTCLPMDPQLSVSLIAKRPIYVHSYFRIYINDRSDNVCAIGNVIFQFRNMSQLVKDDTNATDIRITIAGESICVNGHEMKKPHSESSNQSHFGNEIVKRAFVLRARLNIPTPWAYYEQVRFSNTHWSCKRDLKFTLLI